MMLHILKALVELRGFEPLTLPMQSGCSLRKVTLGGGAEGIRTPDPLLAKQVLSQLSYSPTPFFFYC